MPSVTLYSFRRCPYAMRARLGIWLAQCTVELREIILKHKPLAMLEASPKGTVPVLILQDGTVIDESLDIIKWALQQNDPLDLRRLDHPTQQALTASLIQQNDNDFKPYLDKYKYADRHPEQHAEDYREQGEHFIARLEQQLQVGPYLLGERLSLADIAIFPFIRQFAHVDLPWWQQAPYPKVQTWLQALLNSEMFNAIMVKYPTWLDSGEAVIFTGDPVLLTSKTQ